MKIATDEVDAHGVGSDPDAMLALRARNDPEAFGLLYARYVHRATSYLLLRTRIREDAEDLASQCFVRAFETLPRFRAGEGSVRSCFSQSRTTSLSATTAHTETPCRSTPSPCSITRRPSRSARSAPTTPSTASIRRRGRAEPDGELGAAIAWLREALKDGPLPSKQVIDEAKENGFAARTLKRAKTRGAHSEHAMQEAGAALGYGRCWSKWAQATQVAHEERGCQNPWATWPLASVSTQSVRRRRPLYIRSPLRQDADGSPPTQIGLLRSSH